MVTNTFKRWIEVAPLANITASSIAWAFLETWISRFGVPLCVVSDRGAQITSKLSSELSKVVGFHRLRRTVYHPQANGMVERCHRTLKVAIMARNESWLGDLPLTRFKKHT